MCVNARIFVSFVNDKADNVENMFSIQNTPLLLLATRFSYYLHVSVSPLPPPPTTSIFRPHRKRNEHTINLTRGDAHTTRMRLDKIITIKRREKNK